ncbi:molybdopterin-dependent oxidoreductase [Dongia rigui]|uniref:Molybdopterin-dependent oxidoreductase n=1 Tax=Dongia rigui TaxID=940149 RepID=A0ABU5DUR9_9PROT|nr:molybdopterin-dependent oxidoreductase [Dongia rigui]MDY0870958.1 molybdopterin-dependent oxidoreductase [Dongia rigui]
MIRLISALILGLSLLASGVACAQEDPVLTVDGAIGKGPSMAFTMAQLDALTQTEIKTKTPWHDGVHVFTGPKLRLVLDTVEAKGSNITAHALNDYSADLPVEDADKYGVILATRMDGELLPVRDKGPIFIIYPYDSDPVLQHDVYYTRSVWQIDKLTLK